MQKPVAFRETTIRRASRMAIISLVSASLPLSHAGLPIKQSPPVISVQSEPAPNIILTLDDSGSMLWVPFADVKPNEINPATNTRVPHDTPTRIDLLKNAVKEAFDEYDNGTFRLAYQKLNQESGAYAMSDRFRKGASSTDDSRHKNLMKPFEGQHRKDFFEWIKGFAAGGGTPLRESTIKAAKYIMGELYDDQKTQGYVNLLKQNYTYDNKKFSYDPLNGLDCRRNVHILMTDGEWNDTIFSGDSRSLLNDKEVVYKAGYDSNGTWVKPWMTTTFTGIMKVYDGDPSTEKNLPVPQSGTLDANTTLTPYSAAIAKSKSGYLYTDQWTDGVCESKNFWPPKGGQQVYGEVCTRGPTLADLAFNFWASDLRTDLYDNVPPIIRKRGTETFTWNGKSQAVEQWWNPKNNPATWQNMQTYTIGFGPVARLDELKTSNGEFTSNSNDYMYQGKFFGEKITGVKEWPKATSESTQTRYDLWHAAYNGRGKYYPATTGSALKEAFSEILATIVQSTSAQATVSAAGSSSRLTSDTMAYIAGYKAEDNVWSGKLEFWKVGNLGVSSAKPAKEASVPAANSRVILTSVNGTGKPFQWSSVTDKLSESSTPKLSDLNLGADANAVVNPVRNKTLGDIVHSGISLVGKPQADFMTASYKHFYTKMASRTRMVYVGANDGMLHGFDAGQATPANPGTGVEKLAYIPRGILPRLKNTLDSSTPHQYLVDGSPFTGDAQIANAASEKGAGKYNGWRTVLVGTPGRGGKGYFILNVTNPEEFTEDNAANIVLADTTDSTDLDMGYQISEPTESTANLTQSAQIVRINLPSAVNNGNKQWAAILGNGFNSANGKPVLLVQSLEGDKTLYKIDACKLKASDTTDTNAAKCDAKPESTNTNDTNGLSTPRPIDINGDGTADLVYAGDMQGNMWKFDISSSTASNWKVGLNGSPLFTAKGLPSKKQNDLTKAYRQSITAAPMVVAHPKGGFMVAFGTGRNITELDNKDNRDSEKIAAEGYRFNTFYGIHDAQKFILGKDGSITLDESSAVGVSSTLQAASPTTSRFATLRLQNEGVLIPEESTKIRKGASSISALSASEKGWYFDLPEINFGNATKVLQNPWMMRDNVVAFFSTNVSNEYVSGGGGADGTEESCNVSIRYSPARTQINFFDLFSGVNPNIPVYLKDSSAGANESGNKYNRFQIDDNHLFLKGQNKVVGTEQGGFEPRPPQRSGKFSGWRIIK